MDKRRSGEPEWVTGWNPEKTLPPEVHVAEYTARDVDRERLDEANSATYEDALLRRKR